MRYGNQKYGNSAPTYGGQPNITAADIAFSIHTQVEDQFYDTLYPDYEWPEILERDQIMESINPGATTAAYIVRDTHGAAAFVGNGPNDNIPMVGQSAGAVQIPVAASAIGARITSEDARQYSFGFNGDLARDLGEAMRKGCDNLVESSIIFGNEALGFQPWINYAGINVTTAAVGAGGSTAWADKTAEEIVRDINSALVSIWEESRTIFKPLDIYLPLQHFALLGELPITIGGTGTAVTVVEFLAKNNVMYRITGEELRFHPSRYLADAGTGGGARMIVMDRSRRNQCFPFPLPYTLSAPIPKELAAEWYAEQKFGSYHVRQQGSMLYVDGI